MAVTVITPSTDYAHEEGTNVEVRDGHLVVNFWSQGRNIWAPVAIYAPGQWMSATVDRSDSSS